MNLIKLKANEYQFFWKFGVWLFHEVLVEFEKYVNIQGRLDIISKQVSGKFL
jgi:hypothetical protein